MGNESTRLCLLSMTGELYKCHVGQVMWSMVPLYEMGNELRRDEIRLTSYESHDEKCFLSLSKVLDQRF